MHKTSSPILASLIAGMVLSGTAAAQDEATRTDWMTFAQGTLPVAIATPATDLRVTMTQAIAIIDGNPVGFVVTQKPGAADAMIEVTYALPTPTRFDRFAVPNINETPSPSQTFFKTVEVLGSDQSADGPFAALASGELSTHTEDGSVTELAMVPDQPEVLWVKLRLSGGINVERDQTFFEFSELIGNGTQQPGPMSDTFSGVWKGRGVNIELAQDGPSVTGCYDKVGKLNGSVDGRVLRALGTTDAGIASQFILIATDDGALRGLRSSNGAPFKPYDGETSADAPECLPAEAPSLGCGAIIHGIGFDFDSDAIRPESAPLISELHAGLSAETGITIQIVGHSSAEGAADYNRDLSQRRAQAVVTALNGLGLDTSSISAIGKGEDEPIASNDDEAGRSLNRRVEIICQQ